MLAPLRKVKGVRPALGLALLSIFVFCIGCNTPDLSSEGAKVTVSPDAPRPECVEIKYVVGRGGGTFGGEYITNEDLIEYAMNDLRNEAAELGANYVRHDPPTLGDGDGTTTTATVSGMAFKCPVPTNTP
jgi:hypothetical protein